MRKRIGIFKLGYENVACFVDDTQNGSGTMNPNDNGQCRITIGIAWDCFSDVEELMLHESLEVVFFRLGVVFRGAIDIGAGNDQYRYIFNHPELTEACARAAWWCFKVRPLIKKSWTEHRKKKAKKKKRGKNECSRSDKKGAQ